MWESMSIHKTVRAGSLNDGNQWDAWVYYDGEGKRIEVFLSRNGSKPLTPFLGYDIYLSDILPEKAMVGFSASTGFRTESHTLLSWELSCKTSWNTSFLSIETKPNETLGKTSYKTVIVICAVAAVAAVLAVVLSGGYWYLHIKPTGPRKFTYAELNAATKNFSDSEKLGREASDTYIEVSCTTPTNWWRSKGFRRDRNRVRRSMLRKWVLSAGLGTVIWFSCLDGVMKRESYFSGTSTCQMGAWTSWLLGMPVLWIREEGTVMLAVWPRRWFTFTRIMKSESSPETWSLATWWGISGLRAMSLERSDSKMSSASGLWCWK